MAKIKLTCKHCGSTDVRRGARAKWDVEAQKWVLASLLDDTDCAECGAESRLIEEEVQ